MPSTTFNREELIEKTLQLVDEGVYDSICQANRATGASYAIDAPVDNHVHKRLYEVAG